MICKHEHTIDFASGKFCSQCDAMIDKNNHIIYEERKKVNNPIPELISDEIFELLNKHSLFDEIKLRNHKMKRDYRMLREMNMRQGDAIELIQKDYPYLQFDSIKRICVSEKSTILN